MSPRPQRRRVSARTVSLLGTLFVAVVVAIVVYRHTLVVPLYLGLIAWAKVAVKSVTPKLGMLLLKNGAVVKGRDIAVDVGTRFFVTSHRPWRRRLVALRQGATEAVLGVFRRYLSYPLWVRCLIAIALLAVTASSTWVVFALLIVPQPIIEWLKLRVRVILNKLGVLKSLDAVWRWLLPERLRTRWDRYRTWTLARRQLRAAREVRARLAPRLARPVDAMMRAPLLGRLRTAADILEPARDTDPMVAYRLLDYREPGDAALLVQLLDGYARDPMGGAEPLASATRERLAGVLADTPGAFSIVAEADDGTASGLANCFTTVSTFAARPLVNIHDVFVTEAARGRGIGRGLLQAVEERARALGACKITLEVLEGNAVARAAYERFGFRGYALDDATGSALFWQKTLG